MSRRLLSHEIHVHAWLGASELSVHWAGYVRHLLDQGYRKSTVLPYRAAVAHFGHWMTVHSVRLRNLNEAQVERFLRVIRQCVQQPGHWSPNYSAEA
jgi:site-specific recombinase XerD